MPSIASLGVSVYARTGQFDKAMRRASRTVGKFGASLRRFSGYASVIAGGGLGVLAVRSFQTIDALAKTSDKLGISTEALSAFREQANRAGVETKSFDTALQRMVRRVAEAAAGTGEAKDALKQLGLDPVALNAAGPEATLGAIADAFERLGSESDRVRFAFKLFDTEGVALVNVLRGGSKVLDEARKRAEKLGISLTRIDAAKVEEANEAFGEIRSVIEGVFNRLSVEFAPFVTESARALVEWGTSGEGAAERIHNGMAQVVKLLGRLGDGWVSVKNTIDLAAAATLKLAQYTATVASWSPPAVAARAVNAAAELIGKDGPVQWIKDLDAFKVNAAGAAEDLFAQVYAREGAGSPSAEIEKFFNTIVDGAAARAKAAGIRAPKGVDAKKDQPLTLGSFKEVDLRRIALNSQAGISKRQEVHDPALDTTNNLLRRIAGMSGGAVAV